MTASEYMKMNERKCHLMMEGHTSEHIWEMVCKTIIFGQNKIKLFGVHSDSMLSFNDHVTSLCDKAGRKFTLYCKTK